MPRSEATDLDAVVGALRDRVKQALLSDDAAYRFAWGYPTEEDGLEMRGEIDTGALAGKVLAALGLDDLDAAVERGAISLVPYTTTPKQVARFVLEAALTATPESENTDG